jgi:hypothetical protein
MIKLVPALFLNLFILESNSFDPSQKERYDERDSVICPGKSKAFMFTENKVFFLISRLV